MAELGLVSVFVGLISLIALISFFVMVVNIGNIRRNVQSMQRILDAWSRDQGIGERYTCGNCKKVYTGRLPKCPYCGDEKVYK